MAQGEGMRILHFTPLMAQGGAERHVVELMRQLQPYAEQHLVILYPRSRYPFFFEDEVKALGIPVTFLDKRAGKVGRLSAGWRYWRVVRRFQPDIVHAHQWHAMDVARAFHHFFPVKGLVCTVPTILAQDRLAAERRFANHADAIAVVSDVIAEQYRQSIPQCADRLVTIPVGVDTERFQPADRAQARAALFSQMPLDVPLALYVGRYSPEKNVHVLLEAIKRLTGTAARFVFCGRVDNAEYFEQLKETARSLAPQVELLGGVERVEEFYPACDVLVLPSAYEGLPTVVLEAGACGRPALVSAAANAGGVVLEGQTGWVVPTGDAAALAEKLAYVLSLSPAERDGIGEAARQHVVDHYSMAAVGQKYLRLYERLLARGRR